MEQLMHSLPGFILLCCISKVELDVWLMSLAILICLSGVVLLSILELVIGYSAFKLGRVESIVEFIDALMLFNDYPLTILINPIRMLFTYIIPFMFFSTIPAQIVTGKIAGLGIIGALGILIGVTILWIVIHQYFWKKGVENYESYNG